MQIAIFTTGGTIDKVYFDAKGNYHVGAPMVRELLVHARLGEIPEITELLRKDSLEMTDADRRTILESIEQMLAERSPFVITHGTDTMVQTGLYLQQALPELKVPIVLTGAMTPLGFEGSDGLQNLTESLFAVRILDPGIYVVMHNQAFPIDRVRKERETSRFVWID